GIATAGRRLRTCCLLLTLILLGGIFAHAFQAADPDQAAAKSVLARMSAANGWGKGALPRDAVITATITRHFTDAESSTPFTIKMRGREQYRYAEDGSPVLLIASGAAGAMVGADGKPRRIPAHSALSSRGLVLPMMTVLADWHLPDVDVKS